MNVTTTPMLIPSEIGKAQMAAGMDNLPRDFGGYQNVTTGIILANDLLVGDDGVLRVCQWAADCTGRLAENVICRVYRKIPVAHQGDLDHRQKATTADDGKPALANLPWAALREVAAVQGYGHKKYGDFNNYRKGMEVTRQVSCIIRHLAAFIDGKDRDDESGLPHVAHAATRTLFLLQNIADGKVIDDRFKPDAL